MSLIDLWKRRAWRRDAAAIAALSGSRPACLVTGGSDGIGYAIAEAFAGEAGTVVLIARDPAKLEAARERISATASAEVLTFPLDVTNPSASDEIRAFLAAHDLYADILVNSAGIGTTGPFAETSPEELTDTTQLNVTALTKLCRAFLPDMLVRGRGGIINIASLGGFMPGPYQATYYASKAYVVSFTRALAYETRGLGARISCVAPGPVNTEFHARADAETSLYRRILPAVSPSAVAASTRRGYHFGHTLIIPGIIASITSWIVRILPGRLTTPILAILLKPRSF